MLTDNQVEKIRSGAKSIFGGYYQAQRRDGDRVVISICSFASYNDSKEAALDAAMLLALENYPVSDGWFSHGADVVELSFTPEKHSIIQPQHSSAAFPESKQSPQ